MNELLEFLFLRGACMLVAVAFGYWVYVLLPYVQDLPND